MSRRNRNQRDSRSVSIRYTHRLDADFDSKDFLVKSLKPALVDTYELYDRNGTALVSGENMNYGLVGLPKQYFANKKNGNIYELVKYWYKSSDGYLYTNMASVCLSNATDEI